MTQPQQRPLHPFPARMAPDVALSRIEELTKPGEVVLDPMCGSGTVPRLAMTAGRQVVASDMDPLAVLMTRTACHPRRADGLESRARQLVEEALKADNSPPSWMSEDADTASFAEYWFAEPQRLQLNRLARSLHQRPRTDDPLRLALSRLIVTKDSVASLARDASHSRPHRVRLDNDFDVFEGFIKSSRRLERQLEQLAGQKPRKVSVRTCDARTLSFVRSASVDLVLTSPPYLNAIDYLRGHRLALVWFGWTLGQLRAIRGDSIGAERKLESAIKQHRGLLETAVDSFEDLAPRSQGMIARFVEDMSRLSSSMARVTTAGGRLVFVVADSQLRGCQVRNSEIASRCAENAGFVPETASIRELPAAHRYLPPPSENGNSMDKRMRTEHVLTFRRAA